MMVLILKVTPLSSLEKKSMLVFTVGDLPFPGQQKRKKRECRLSKDIDFVCALASQRVTFHADSFFPPRVFQGGLNSGTEPWWQAVSPLELAQDH